MSGFAAIVRLDGAPLERRHEPTLRAMAAQVAHRGLSARATCFSGALGAALAEAPGEDGVLVAVDGRIHNLAELRERLGGVYREGSPEAIVARLHATRGGRFIEELEGTFAILVWDPRAGVLLLARDRIGARPLFFARAGRDVLLVGSEVKALLAHPACPREVDWVAALARIASPRRARPRTSYFRGVEAVGAGEVVVVDVPRAAVERRRYHAFEHPPAEASLGDDRTDAQLIDAYRAAFERAVDAALGPEPSRAGLLLSGGIDSVSIGAVAAKRARIPTFTVLGRSTLGNGDARLAAEAAAALGLPNHQVLFGPRDAMTAEQWRRLLWLCETPDCAAQQLYKVHLHRAARDRFPDLAVMLNGEGSDELIGADFANVAEDRPDAGYEDYLADLADKQREMDLSIDALLVEGWIGERVFDTAFLARAAGSAPPHPWHRRIRYNLDAYEHDVLWRDDRMAAAHGMVSDAPFLDRRLIDLVMRIPPRAYPSLFWRKRILREAMRGIVPDALREAPKIPFFAGVDHRYTSRLLFDTLLDDDRALIREAFGDRRAHPVLAAGLIDTLVEAVSRDPAREGVYPLLVLTNLGVLESMARDVAVQPHPGAAIPALRTIEAWDEDEARRLLVEPRAPVPLDRVLRFAGGVYVVRPDVWPAQDGPSYVVVDDEVRYVVEGEETRAFREVLRRIDGERTLGAILAEAGVEEAEIRERLEEALEHDVLTVRT